MTSGEAALPAGVAAHLPTGCQFSTAGMPQQGAAIDIWGRSLHQTAPLHQDWCESLLTTAGIYLAAIEVGPEARLARTTSRLEAS